MMKKSKKLVYWFLILTLIGIESVDAWTGAIGFADTGGSETENNEDSEITESLGESNGITYTCVYSYNIDVNNSVTIDGYSLDDESILTSSLNIADEDRILAGTSIGLNISEYKKVSWSVTKADAMESKVQTSTSYLYSCTYTPTTTNSGGGCTSGLMPNRPNSDVFLESCIADITLFSRIQFIATSCDLHDKSNQAYCPSVPGCTTSSRTTSTITSATTSTPVKTSNAAKQAECESKAIEAATTAASKYLYPSYEVSLPDSNEVDGTTNITIKATGGTPSIPKEKSGEVSVTYQYKPKKVCLNVLNATVRYVTSDDDCNSSEIEVENGTNHWHYFVPLGAKSNYETSVNLMPSNQGTLAEGQCKYVMENNPMTASTTYMDLIVKVDKTDFNGDYSKGAAGKDAKSIKDGCYLTSKVKIPIVQKFYNEVTDKNGNITFKGFNFYYRPISVTYEKKSDVPNVVFPNGVATNSLWYDWSENWKKNKYLPDLTQSYASATYIVTDMDLDKIRKYNEDNPYTSWLNMSTNGSSLYINDGTNGITRKNSGHYYELGCGPSNADWSDCK